MPSVADLIHPTRLPELATPATLRLGRELAASGAVQLLEVTPHLVRGKVGGAGGSQLRTTELRVVNGALEWSCTCTGKTLFCKHCAALAIALWDQPPA